MAKLNKMTKEELAKERAEAEARLRELQKAEAEFDGRRLRELKAEIEKTLSAEGFTMADLFAGRAPKKTGGAAKAPAKYRHPENASKTWSGRGRQPQWFKDHVDGGGKAEDLAV